MSNETAPPTTAPPAEQWEQLQEKITQIRSQTARVIVGQDKIVEEMLVSFLCKGHCLLTGVPGLAKTLLVSTLGHILGLKFSRIQFTPDLMPTDIVGSEILQTDASGSRAFKFVPGPIFSNILLADEINRTPPKTQAALLEAMQEKQVTVSGETRKLDEPFIVFATQNPIEQEGTYPLPEAQLDRFFFNLHIDYPTMAEEEEIVNRTTGRKVDKAEAILDSASVLALQDAVHDVPLPENVVKYILKITHRSRPNTEAATSFVNDYVDYGAGPRASQCMARAARALALLRGRSVASEEEVRAVALPILRHRIIPNYNATGEGITVNDIIAKLLLD
jgi:MoxR-like ATPase